MGRESRAIKPRPCPFCLLNIRGSASSHLDHIDLCRRMKNLNLILPTLQTPTLEEIMRKGGT